MQRCPSTRPPLEPHISRCRIVGGARGTRDLWRFRALSSLAVLVFASSASLATAQTLLFHSPGDDGVPSTSPLEVGPDSTATLFLYMATGAIASSVPEDVCVAGDGDEICALQIGLRAEGALAIVDFVPDAALDAAHVATPVALQLNVLDPVAPVPGTKRLGELGVSAGALDGCGPTPCRVVVDLFDVVQADLALAAGGLTTPDATIAVPEPGGAWALGLGALGLLGFGAPRREHLRVARRQYLRAPRHDRLHAPRPARDRRSRRAAVSPRATTAIALVALAMAFPATAQLATLPDAHYITQCDDGPQRDLPVANTSFCDRPQIFSWTASGGTSMATAEAVVSAEAFSSRPRIPAGVPAELALRLVPLLSEPFAAIAFVQASATYETSGPLQAPPPGFGASQIDGMAAVEATFVVRQIAVPPIPVTEVPLVLRVFGEMTVSGAGNNRGSFRVTVNGDPEDSFTFISPAGGFYSVDSEFPGEFFTIEEDQTFIKQVTCSAEARWPVGSGFCSAVLDPILALDQATADALLGADTFPLADYFAIELSENFLVDAPANVCGDVSLDDFVLTSDLDLLRDHLNGVVTLSEDALDRCATRSASTGCDLADAVVLARTVGAAPRPPGIAPVCPAAL